MAAKPMKVGRGNTNQSPTPANKKKRAARKATRKLNRRLRKQGRGK